MRKGNRIKVLVLGTVLLMGTGTLLALSARQLFSHHQAAPNHKPMVDTIAQKISYDTALLKKFRTVCRSFDVKKEVFTYSGTVSIHDGADTANNVQGLTFFYSRKGNDYYYKNGNTETLNAEGVYLYIERDHKRVLISGQKQVPAPALPDMGDITEKMRSEHYRLTDKRSGAYETIALINEHHITCKEYAVTFDTVYRKMKNISMRLSCFADPLNKTKEKVVNMTINDYRNTADIGSFPDKHRVIAKENGKCQLSPLYSNYELIQIP
jgi:hypothetical protein